VWAYIY